MAEKVGWDLKSKERLNMVGVDTKVGIKTDLVTKRLRSLISHIKIQDEDKNFSLHKAIHVSIKASPPIYCTTLRLI